MKNVSLFFLQIFFGLQCFSQAPPWEWATDAGGPGNDLGKAISTDENGNSYTTGRFNATCNFGNLSLTSYGGPDIYISKYDTYGNCLWVKHAGSYDTQDIYGDEGLGIDIDADRNCYVTGNFYTQAMFGPVTLTCPNQQRQIFVAKYDSSGNEIWAIQPTGNQNNNYSRAIAVDSIGNSYITGYLGGGTNTFGTYSVSGPGAFVVKFDSSGNALFATKLCTYGGIDAYGIDIDRNGNSYVTGYLQGNDLINGQSFTSSGMRDAFLIKVDSTGNFVWLRQTQSMAGTVAYGWGVTVDMNNEPVFVGDYDNYVMVGTILLSGQGCMTAKFDSAGNVHWAKQSVSPGFIGGFISGLAITSDNQNKICITGNYHDSLLFDTQALSDYGSQTFVTQYDSAGNCLWATGSQGQNSGAFGYGISRDNNGSYFVTGFYKAPPTFGTHTVGFAGGEDVFVAKLGSTSPLANFTAADNTLCPGTCVDFNNLSLNGSSYQWFFPGAVPNTSTDENPTGICYSTSGIYDVTLVVSNFAGTDTLSIPGFITIYPAPPAQAITQSGDTLFAIPGASGYQWYENGNLIPGATDYFYVATHSGDYNVVTTDENDCEVEAVINNVIASIQYTVDPPKDSIQIEIFPNPVTEYLNIHTYSLAGTTNSEFSIFNIMGEKIYSDVYYERLTVNCGMFSPGVYILEVTFDNKIFRNKFVKQ